MRQSFIAAIAVMMLAAACSGSSSSTPTPDAQRDAMRPVAVEFLQAAQAVNHDHMMTMIDSSTMYSHEIALGCTLAAGCPPRDAANVSVDDGGTTCRAASKSESSSGYGAVCQFDLRFDERATGSDSATHQGKMCVKVQQKGDQYMVMDAYRLLRTDAMLGSLSGSCLPI